jgi:glycolate oxidase iron-sulfur subunit
MTHLLRELKRQEEKLFNCVHCGFCLPACPTYTRLGDEADSPRGRLHFMRAVVEGRVDPGSLAFNRHLDRCLGCRACESVCPSGVEYGRLLEGARDVGAKAKKRSLLSRALPAVMGSTTFLPPLMFLTRVLRGSGLPGLVVRKLPGKGLSAQMRLGMGMIAATALPRAFSAGGVGKKPQAQLEPGAREEEVSGAGRPSRVGAGKRTALLVGCVQEGLLSRVNEATRRVLGANGYEIVEAKGQKCCGAIHSHTGDLEGARALARANIEAFEAADVEVLAVNAAGCCATMKEYPHLLEDDPAFHERAGAVASRVRDVSELLALPGLRVGGPLPLTVTYDAPCHLLHAQRISQEPLALLGTIPGLELIPLKGADECCGGAGIYGITHPDLGGRIGRDKVEAILATGAQAVATGNPGCMMQIGAGLRMVGSAVDVVHPVELLAESYRRGGVHSGG